MLSSVGFSKSTFIISLDLELAWGSVLDPKYRGLALLLDDPKRGRGTVNLLLGIFEKYDIPATWATVGRLFLDRYGFEKRLQEDEDSMYSRHIRSSMRSAPLLYHGKDIIEKILSSPVKHKIALHSFSHILFPQCQRKIAVAEVKEGIKSAQELGITLKSFVFPYNEIGHVDVLKENGFKIYRGENLVRGKESQSFLIRKMNKAIDELMAPPTEPKWRDGIWEIPSSMAFCDPQIPFCLLPKAKLGLLRAIGTKKVFHIFLHPWSLLSCKSLAQDLEAFLSHVSVKRREGKLQVFTMGELADRLQI